MSTAYDYAAGDLLARPHTYFYSTFGGAALLEAWRAQRLETARWFDATATAPEPGAAPADGACRLFAATAARLVPAESHEALQVVAQLVQRFEVTKRVYGAYDAALRPVDREDFRVLVRYVAFGDLLECAYRVSRRLPCLNALLKLNDILGAHREALPAPWRSAAARLQREELHHVAALAEAAGVA